MKNTNLNILTTHTLLPPIRHEKNEAEKAFMQWLSGQDRDTQIKSRKILRNAGVDARYSFLTLEEIFTPCSLTESTRRYRENAIELGTQVLREGLEKAEIKPDEVDILITTSCTGFMIPSVDAYMADRLGMRSDLLRIPITEMGCAAGASGLIYAAKMLRGNPGGIAAVVNIEFPSNTIQLQDFSFDNIIGTVLFSDGLGCTILRQGGEPGVATIIDSAMHQIFETTHVLGYQLTNGGLLMNLDQSLPDVIAEHFYSVTTNLLSPHNLTLQDIKHFVIHPGGVKILDRIQTLLDPFAADVVRSREIMRRFGNMSSSTVIFILESLLLSQFTPGPVLMMSFGPGFGAHQLLLSLNDRINP